ncbi:MAG: coiled coil domain-containing protein [Anaerolineales bacterium]|nr:coiled coil domain-containing protein [Anaerolineales bacterium]
MLNINQKTMEAYQQKARAQIKEMKARMQMFEARVENATADLKIKYQNNLIDWKARFEDIENKMKKISESSGEAWEDIRTGIDNALGELQSAIQKGTDQFK